MKLTHVNDLFAQNHLQFDEPRVHDFCAFDQFLYDLFPYKHDLAATVRNLRFDDPQHHQTLTMKDLPYHTRDNNWLAQYVTKAIQQLDEFNHDPERCHNVYGKKFLPYHTIDGTVDTIQSNQEPWPNISHYVTSAPRFDKFRCRYEQDVVKEYINCVVHHLQPVRTENEALATEKNYDQLLRCYIVQAMVDLGIDRHSIETSLEINANLWRASAMQQACQNTYRAELDDPNLCKFLISQNPPMFTTFIQWREIRTKLQKLWLKQREFTYYQKHHEIIDELHLATPNMLLTPDQVKRLQQNLRHCERLHEKMRAKFQQAAQTITIGRPAAVHEL